MISIATFALFTGHAQASSSSTPTKSTAVNNVVCGAPQPVNLGAHQLTLATTLRSVTPLQLSVLREHGRLVLQWLAMNALLATSAPPRFNQKHTSVSLGLTPWFTTRSYVSPAKLGSIVMVSNGVLAQPISTLLPVGASAFSPMLGTILMQIRLNNMLVQRELTPSLAVETQPLEVLPAKLAQLVTNAMTQLSHRRHACLASTNHQLVKLRVLLAPPVHTPFSVSLNAIPHLPGTISNKLTKSPVCAFPANTVQLVTPRALLPLGLTTLLLQAKWVIMVNAHGDLFVAGTLALQTTKKYHILCLL